MTYWVNIAHKFNLKLDGINYRLPPDALGILGDGDTMVVGINVTHPTPKSMENSPSIFGMVASIDDVFAHWPGNFKIQKSRQEIQKLRQEKKKTTGEDDIPKDEEDMVGNVEILLGERLSVFGMRNQKYPKNILIYRDGKRSYHNDRMTTELKFSNTGVSEGQYPAVLDLELKPMKELCARLYREKNLEPPKFTVVIVGKRHHTRFYPTRLEDADEIHGHNPRPGTVVDRGITMQKGWDFYLQAHAALKGTVSVRLPQDPSHAHKNTGETGTLCRDPQRHETKGRRIGKDHPQSLLPVRTIHQGRLLLSTGVLCRQALRARPLLSYEVPKHARSGPRCKVRSRRRRRTVEGRCA